MRGDFLGRQVEVLRAVCDLPTAPFCEEQVVRWVEGWARGMGLTHWRDGAGNVYVEYVRGGRSETPLVVEAHMDHPGFLVVGGGRGGMVRAEFRGGVKPSFFEGAGVRFFVEKQDARSKTQEGGRRREDAKRIRGHMRHASRTEVVPEAWHPARSKNQEDGRWVKGRVSAVKAVKGKKYLDVRVACAEKVPVGSLGMWDLPDAEVRGEMFCARVCDDLAGVAAMICLMEELVAEKVKGHVICLFDRAEEVGFAGVLAVCENGWIPKGSRVIGLETSKASSVAKQGEGVVVRVGDRTGIFSAGLTHFLSQAAGFVGDEDSSFKFQRRLMDGGMCNSTPFAAWGYDSAALCVALGNYHNMTVKGEAGWKVGSRTGKGIGSESIHLRDFDGMVRVLVEVVKRYGKYKPGFGEVRERLAKMHREEHLPMLYETVDRVGGRE